MAIDSNELLGQALGTCTLQRLLGRGGMGVVYLARQSRPRRTVAVKVLIPGVRIEPEARAEFLARFRREADAIAALDHVNIMPIYEYGEQGDIAYLVMPFVTGGTLRNLLDKQNILPLTEVVPIIEQAAMALDCAHAQGIIHRDLKPANILFHADGRALLADFGLAKVVRGYEEHDSSSDGLSSLTSAGMIIGTPEYLSPEQSTAQPIGPYTDIYALGVVLYQLLGGHVPFSGASPVAVALKHALEAPVPLSQINPKITPQVEAVVMKALAKQPEKRYQQAGEFAHALRVAAGMPLTTQTLNRSTVENIATVTVAPEHNTPNEHSTQDMQENPPYVPPTRGISKVSTAEHPAAFVSTDLSEITTSEDSTKHPPVADSDLPTYHTEALAKKTDPHASLTEEAPRLVSPKAPSPIYKVQPVTPKQTQQQEMQEPVVLPGLQAQNTLYTPNTPRVHQRLNNRSYRLIALGILLILVLVVGSFAINLIPKQTSGNAASTPITTKTPHRTTTATVPVPQQFTPPKALVPVGKMLYGTFTPGSPCDQQGGQWSNQSNVQVTCNASGSKVTNNSGGMAGIFLDKLSGNKSLPNNYVLQVQLTMNTNIGQFGISFRTQHDTPTGGYAFLYTGANSGWNANSYDQTGTTPTLTNFSVYGQQDGTNTLDLLVQNGTFTIYLNNNQQGAMELQTILYQSGNLGLVIDTRTSITFKNLVIYQLP